jgi:hypothetical protein
LELVREDTAADTRPPSKLLEELAVSPPPLPVGRDGDTQEDRLADRLFGSMWSEAAGEPTGERRLPWPIDILLYPASLGGLTTLVIIVGIPLLLELIPLILVGWLIGIVIGLYSIWYLAECVYDSAKGGTRAPLALDTTDLGQMWSRAVYLAAVYILFVLPAVVYRMFVDESDAIFWGLVAWAAVFFPMGLLAMVIDDSVSALNPLFLLGAIVRTFFPYVGLVALLGIAVVLRRLALSRLTGAAPLSPLLAAPVSFATLYVSFILAHILGRFYWRYRERLDWGI